MADKQAPSQQPQQPTRQTPTTPARQTPAWPPNKIERGATPPQPPKKK